MNGFSGRLAPAEVGYLASEVQVHDGGVSIPLDACWTLACQRDQRRHHYNGSWENTSRQLKIFLGVQRSILDIAKSGEWAMSDWVVEGLFPRGNLVLLSGEAGVGKSWAVLDLMKAVISGGKWLGHFECDQGPVVYACGGDGSDKLITSRMIGLIYGSGVNPRRFLEEYGSNLTVQTADTIGGVTFPLSSAQFRARVLDQLSGVPREALPTLWVFDPIGALVEDLNGDGVREVVIWGKRLAQMTGGLVIFVNHLNVKNIEGLSSPGKIRGNQFFYNLADHSMELTCDPDDKTIAHATWSKAKDVKGPDDARPAFSIRRAVTQLSLEESDEVLTKFDLDPRAFPPKTAYKAVLFHQPYVEKSKDAGSETKIDVDAPSVPQDVSDFDEPLDGEDEPTGLSEHILALLADVGEEGLTRYGIEKKLKERHQMPVTGNWRLLNPQIERLLDEELIIAREGYPRSNSVSYMLKSEKAQ